MRNFKIKHLLTNIFSIKNEELHKVITVLGIKFKFKNKNYLYCFYNNMLFNFLQSIVVVHGVTYEFLKIFETLEQSNFMWETQSNCLWLMYISALIELGEKEKAKTVLKKYIQYHQLKDIERYFLVADFACSQNIYNDKIKMTAQVFQKLEEFTNNNEFLNLIKGKTIALVGCGPSELGKNKGVEIDSHDIVIRMNNYQIKGFESDYGSRTDIWIRGFGGREQKDYSINNQYKLVGVTGDYYHIPVYWFKQVEILHRDMLNGINTGYINRWKYLELRQKFIKEPTTGLVLIDLLIELKKELNEPLNSVDFYGFSFLENTEINQATHYYHDKKEKYIGDLLKMHDINLESEYIRDLLILE